MEKITSGLPPLSLPLYTSGSDSPPNAPTLISPILNPNFNTVCINSQSIRFFLLLLYLISSHPIPFSLSILHLTLPLSQGFRLVRRSVGSQFLQFSLGPFHIPACCIIGLPCGVIFVNS